MMPSFFAIHRARMMIPTVTANPAIPPMIYAFPRT